MLISLSPYGSQVMIHISTCSFCLFYTWPQRISPITGQLESFWPGSWSQDFNINLPGCSQSRKDPDCWEEVPGRFISDMDVYMEFDDRWAHRANNVNTNDEYEQTGYPMGLKVMATAHSYGVSYAEDIMFVTVKVRNESGDWCEDEDGNPILVDGVQNCGEGMIMPDGTKLNGEKVLITVACLLVFTWMQTF